MNCNCSFGETVEVWKLNVVGIRKAPRKLFIKETRWAKNEIPAFEFCLLGNCYCWEPLRSDSPYAAMLPALSSHLGARAAIPPALTPPPQVIAPSMAGAGSGQAICLFTLHTSYFQASVFDVNSGHRDPFPHCDKSPENLSCCFELPFKALVISGSLSESPASNNILLACKQSPK